MLHKRDEVTGQCRRQRDSCSVLLTKYYSAEQIKKNVIDGHVACERGGTGDMHTGFRWGHFMEEDHLKDLSVDGRIILKWFLKK